MKCITLTCQERTRFGLWLETRSYEDLQMAEYLRDRPGHTLARRQLETSGLACALVAQRLRTL